MHAFVGIFHSVGVGAASRDGSAEGSEVIGLLHRRIVMDVAQRDR